MGPFLRAEPPAPFIVNSADGKSYIGDPLIAVEVTGSPTGNNFVQIDGPDIGGTGLNTIRNTFFNLSGKLGPLSVDKTAITFLPQKPAPFKTTSGLITVTNLHTVNPLTIGVIAFAGANAADFTLTPGADLCSGKALAPAGTCTFSVDFSGPPPDGTMLADINIPATINTTGIPVTPIAVSGFLRASGVIDSTPPTITSTTPANNAVDVPANHIITATFSEPVTLVTATTFILSTAGTPTVDGTVTYDAASNTATFRPAANLTSNVTYSATITTGVTDIAGNALVNPVVLNFLTTLPDTTPPLVTSNTPTANAIGVRADQPITVTFNEPVDASTVNATSFFLSNGVTGTVAYDPGDQNSHLHSSAALGVQPGLQGDDKRGCNESRKGPHGCSLHFLIRYKRRPWPATALFSAERPDRGRLVSGPRMVQVEGPRWGDHYLSFDLLHESLHVQLHAGGRRGQSVPAQ